MSGISFFLLLEGRPTTPPTRKEPGSTKIPVYHSLPRSGLLNQHIVIAAKNSAFLCLLVTHCGLLALPCLFFFVFLLGDKNKGE